MRYPLLHALALLLLFAPRPALAAPPKPLRTLVHLGLRYEAPHELMGTVIARNVSSGAIVWQQQIYTIERDPEDPDAGDVYITSLGVQHGRLLVINDADWTYYVELRTGKVLGSRPPARRRRLSEAERDEIDGAARWKWTLAMFLMLVISGGVSALLHSVRAR